MKLDVRKTCIICLISVCLFLLTACKGNTPDDSDSKPTVTDTVTPETTAVSEIAKPVEKVTYDVSFNGCYGINTPADAVKVQGEAFIIPEDAPTRKCYTFTGWYVPDEPEKLYLPGDSYTSDCDTEFLASWKLDESTDDPALGTNLISLSGKREDTFVTDKYYYYEGDEFFIYFDKDLKIPGDFCDNIALIMDQLEKETGLSFNCPGVVPAMSSAESFFGKDDPWKNISPGKKVLIYVCADRENACYISSAASNGRYLDLFKCELFSDELWNSVPDYRNNPEWRSDYISYYDVAHELTHTLTSRYLEGTTYITSEGSADYYAERVLSALKERSEDFSKSYQHFTDFNKSTTIAKKITPETAEDIFVTDFSDVDFANRGDEYTFGRMLFEFITERYGETFLKDYLVEAANRGLRSEFTYSTQWAHEPEKHAQLIKDLAGEDVFKEFGKWYQSGKYSK
ncbi:MAG: hypothetical protein J5643_09565 [Lachnospiraceae bacterium]|nr:hypothetical protein [Lachnospiraceae bacterium]